MASTESLSGASARGGVLLLLRKVWANLIRLAAVAVLARKLELAEFGAVTIAQLAVSLLTVFGAGGVGTYIVCDRDDDWQTRVHPAFWLHVVLTLGSCAVAFAALPLVVWIYGQPALGGLLAVIIVTHFVSQLRIVPEALLQRRLEFRVVAMRDGARDVVSAVLAVAMALVGFGAWSLVLPNLVIAPLEVAFTAWRARFWPARALGVAVWRRIFRYTRNVIGVQLLTAIGNETDTAVVGAAQGTAVVGGYNQAYQLANLVGKNVTSVVAWVSTPALAAAYERNAALGPPYRKMMRVLSLISTPILLGMFVLADELVALQYGDKWTGIAPLLRIFIASTLVRSVTSPTGALFSVVGRPEVSLRLAFAFVAVYVPWLLVCRSWSVTAFAIGVAVARILIGLISLYWSLALIDERMLRVTGELVRPLVAGIAMALVAHGADQALIGAGLPIAARVPVVIAVGAAAYLAAIQVVARRAFAELLALVKELRGRRARRPEAPA
jgi:O-antigen/teichoic acid export membrane protein